MAETADTTLQTRLDRKSKQAIEQAAKLRRVGISDYVRLVLVPAAEREVAQAEHRTVQLTASEQEQFFEALEASAEPTTAQQMLGKIMKGDA